jgi:hypothetical protein
MPKSDLEVFERLTQDADTATEINFIAYAMFAFEKKEWIEHHVKISGHPPTQEQIDSWISNITDFQFQNMREKAIDFFDDSARNYLEEEIAQAKQEVLESAIIQKVQSASAFWKQLATALLTAILAPILLGGILASILVRQKYSFPGEVATRISLPDRAQSEVK